LTTDHATNSRLENVERSVNTLSDRVGDIAKFMERLVTIEERNGFMTQKHDELKSTLKEAIAAFTEKNAELEKKVTAIKERMIGLMAVYSVITSIAAVAAPYILKAIQAGVAQ
jgi:regulator of replication initiation timing